jgi:hypothetical protein
MVGKSQETSWKARRVAASKSRRVPHRSGTDSGTPEAAEHGPDTEVSSEERTALQTSGGEKQRESRPAAEDPSKREKTNPSPQ